MMTKVYYIDNNNNLGYALTKIINTFHCSVRREYVEMNYSQIEITARCEDMAGIENILAPLL